MLNENAYERIRRAYHVERKSINQIAQEEGHSRQTITKIVNLTSPKPYQLTFPRPAPIFGPYQHRAEELLRQNENMPLKQRYTGRKIFEILQAEGYQGSESRVRQYLTAYNHAKKMPQVFLPLEYDPGESAQCDWGEAVVVLAGRRQKIQFFLLRLCYSRRAFAMAFPSQAGECFLYAHICAFKHFGGVPRRIIYDNLGTAVKLLPAEPGKRGRVRKEVSMFISFRSHYLFSSHFCTPGIEGAHEKGGVESGIGYTRRQFMVPLPQATSFDDLNRQLLARAFKEDSRRVARENQTIGEAWEDERDHLYPLPPSDFECCIMTTVRLNHYSQVQFETNRYSVPVDQARRTITLKAYPFHVEVWDDKEMLARHERCYGREQDIFDPLHYLPLLLEKPGAFDFAKPIRRWREVWPPSYDALLRRLRDAWPDGRGVHDFIRICALHQEFASHLVERAIEQALSYGCANFDGVSSCLRQLCEEETQHELQLDAAHGGSTTVPETLSYPVDLSRYERLLKLSW